MSFKKSSTSLFIKIIDRVVNGGLWWLKSFSMSEVSIDFNHSQSQEFTFLLIEIIHWVRGVSLFINIILKSTEMRLFVLK